MTKLKILPYNPKLKTLARQLRNNSTLAEVLVWQNIKGKSYGYEFHRQVPIDEFIVDFYCHELKLAVEIDGSTHDYHYHYDYDVKHCMSDVFRALQNTIVKLEKWSEVK